MLLVQYSWTPVTQTLKGNKNNEQCELGTIWVIGVDGKIQFAILKTGSYWFFSTSVYSLVQIVLI